jgi:diadenylate cyclase
MGDPENKTTIDFLKKVSPGTPLRIVIDDLIRADLGGLIVFESPELEKIMDGGFRVNCRFTAPRLFELCKMDGAVVISSDLKRILFANVMLNPDPTITTNETGTRHRAGERTAKQANTFVVAVSERRKKITLYFPKSKYYLRSREDLLREVSSNIQVLEKQREILDELISKLTILEMSGLVSSGDVCKVIQRAEIILHISEAIKRYFAELGKDGNIMNMRYKELLKGVEKSEENILRDYSLLSLKKTKTLLSNFTFEGLLDLESVSRLLLEKSIDDNISASGFRFLSNLNLNEKEVSQIVDELKSLDKIFSANSEDFEKILKNRGEQIKNSIGDLREQILSGKIIY